MKDRRDLELAAGVLAGALLAWSLPEAWFGKALFAALGLVLVMGVLAATVTRGYASPNNGRPRAKAADALALRSFLLSAALALGLLVGIFLL